MKIHQKLWQAYRLVNSSIFEEAEQPSKIVETIAPAKDELPKNKAKQQVLEEEYWSTRRVYQEQLESVGTLCAKYRLLKNTEGRIPEAEGQVRGLMADMTAVSLKPRGTSETFCRFRLDWQNKGKRAEKALQTPFSSRPAAATIEAV